jgi:hypothetical protein
MLCLMHCWMIRLLLLLPILGLLPVQAYAHGGGLDGLGCHHNRKVGGYHCHRGDLVGQSFGSKGEAQKIMSSGAVPTPTPIKNQTYNRKLYRHWIDADGDCQDTRQEVLIEESVEPVVLDDKGCKVLSGRWYDHYTGETFSNPRQLDIDHLVPLAEAHRSGANSWDAVKRKAFANDLSDPRSLIAVKASANRSKSDRDPARWLPINETYRCEYVAAWVAVKERWGLFMDVEETATINRLQSQCYY